MELALKKSITYRVVVAIGALLLSFIFFFISGNVITSLFFGWAIEEFFRFVVYWIHEIFWEKHEEHNLAYLLDGDVVSWS